MDTTIVIVAGFWIVCGLAAGWISSERGNGGLDGFLIGVFFGPLGLLMALTSKPPEPVEWAQPQPPQPSSAAPPSPAWGQQPTPAAAYCPRCGTARAGAFRYCRSCGLDFDAGGTNG